MAKVQHPPAGYRLVQNPDYVIQEGDLWWSTKSQKWYSCVHLSVPGCTLRMARLDFVASNQKQQTCTHDLASLSEMLESLDDDLLYDVVHMACFKATQRARAAADEIDMRLTGYEESLNTSRSIPALSNRLFNNTASGVLDIRMSLDVFKTRFSEPEE